MTPKVRKMISWRSGKLSPASVVSGSASAAASETAPRIPDQATTAFACHEGTGSSMRMRRLILASR